MRQAYSGAGRPWNWCSGGTGVRRPYVNAASRPAKRIRVYTASVFKPSTVQLIGGMLAFYAGQQGQHGIEIKKCRKPHVRFGPVLGAGSATIVLSSETKQHKTRRQEMHRRWDGQSRKVAGLPLRRREVPVGQLSLLPIQLPVLKGRF